MSIGSFVRDRVVPGRGDPITVHDPATGAVAFTYADAGAEVVAEAAATALEGATAWQALGAAERGRRLWALAQRLRDASERVARIEATNVGKPLADARSEVGKVAEMFEYYAGWCDKLMGRVVPVPTSHHNHTRKVPYGVILTITPWNAPLFVAGWNAAPALACGNAVILKPSEWTPASALELARLVLEAGLPEGTLQVLAGLGATTGATAIRHPAVAKVTFVGSPASGRIIAGLCAEAPKPCVLELGGKSANVVFADARLDRATGGAAAAIFAASGQSCVAGSRLLVEQAIHDEVVDRLVALTERIRIGAPLEADTQIGPLQNAQQLARTTALVERAARDGGRLAVGGHRPRSEGYFYAPTVVVGAGNDAEIAQEEVFGPVVTVLPFRGEEEGLALANASAYGLAGAVWTQDPARALRFAHGLRAGTVWVNSYKTIGVMSPFGGFGGSGYGRSSGVEGLEEYLQTQSVWIETADAPAFNFGWG